MVAFNTLKSKFPLGQILATPDALEALSEAGQAPAEFLSLHAQCNWGEMSEGDKVLNDEALVDGSRLMSAYSLKSGTKIWIITEAADENGHRCATTILLPENY